MNQPAHIHVKPAKTEEISPEAQVSLLSSFLNIGKRSFIQALQRKPAPVLSFELVSTEPKTQFFVTAPESVASYITSQIVSQYPKSMVQSQPKDPLAPFIEDSHTRLAYLTTTQTYVLPIKTFKAEQELPPMAGVLGFFAKLTEGEQAAMQVVCKIVNQAKTQRKIRDRLKVTDAEGNEKADEYASIIQRKLSTPSIAVQIRLMYRGVNPAQSTARLLELAGAFGAYTLSEGNSLSHQIVGTFRYKKTMQAIKERRLYRWQPRLTLNLEEAASVWHLPDKKFESMKLIDWGKTVISEPPENVPIAEEISDDDKKDHNFFAKTEWRNHEAIFGIKKSDRRRHMYIIGKTGAGKSTLIANMAINDIRNGKGLAIIDPHGDLSEAILEYVPKRRLNDVIYLDPTLSDERAFSLNLFDADGTKYMDVVASGIVSIFQKLFAHSWGPRLEYILRNTINSLLLYGDATFADMPRLLTNQKFRAQVIAKIRDIDPVLTAFWVDEFEPMNDRLRTESISSILNKVGQFLSSQFIRNVLDTRNSTISLSEIMNTNKILIINLSQGKVGEDTAALLGAMFITKIQLAAMQRVHIAEEDRKDFYLYVDEFQNFATNSFIKILSEARKYRLNLILANQYIDQVDIGVQKAIFGNAGTLITFVVGAADAIQLSKEFGGSFEDTDLVGLGKYQILLKMAINDLTSSPFLAQTLPPPSVQNNNAEKIIRVALERYYRPAKGGS